MHIKFVAVLALALTFIGCPKDPYSAAIKGSDDVAEGVHQSVVAVGKLYSQGTVDDAYKVTAGHYLDVVTDCNMSFRKSAVTAHAAGQVGVQAYLPLADSFVQCTQKAIKPTGTAQNILHALDTAINGVSAAIANAKGGKVGP